MFLETLRYFIHFNQGSNRIKNLKKPAPGWFFPLYKKDTEVCRESPYGNARDYRNRIDIAVPVGKIEIHVLPDAFTAPYF